MSDTDLLTAAMAEKCRNVILAWDGQDQSLSPPLQPEHLVWMCDNIERHTEDWPATKLHRWIGFVQCAMLAQRMLDLNGLKEMFDMAKVAYGESDQDLLDHLDPSSSFDLELGGEG